MDFNLELKYEKKGVLGLCTVDESKYFSIANHEEREAVKQDVIATVKKVLRLFNNNNYFNIWACIYTARDYKNASALIGISQSWSDRDNGVFEVYMYGHNSTITKKVSKDVLLKEVFRAID